MKKNITQKSAPIIAAIPTEPKSVKLTSSMFAVLRDAIQRVQAARADYDAKVQLAKDAQSAFAQLAEMHDGILAAQIVDGGATREEFQYGFEIGQNKETGEYCLRAKPKPITQ